MTTVEGWGRLARAWVEGTSPHAPDRLPQDEHEEIPLSWSELAQRTPASMSKPMAPNGWMSDGCPDPDSEARKRQRFLERVGLCQESSPKSAQSTTRTQLSEPELGELYDALADATWKAGSCRTQARLIWGAAASKGELLTRLDIDAKGRVQNVTVERDDLDNPDIRCCVVRELRGLTLPPLSRPRPITIDYPVGFATALSQRA